MQLLYLMSEHSCPTLPDWACFCGINVIEYYMQLAHRVHCTTRIVARRCNLRRYSTRSTCLYCPNKRTVARLKAIWELMKNVLPRMWTLHPSGGEEGA